MSKVITQNFFRADNEKDRDAAIELLTQNERDKVPKQIQNSSEFASICPSTAVVMKKNLE